MTGPWTYEEFARDHERHVKQIAKIASGRDDRRPDPDGWDRANIMIEYDQLASARRCVCARR
jgi:hypothetical protein